MMSSRVTMYDLENAWPPHLFVAPTRPLALPVSLSCPPGLPYPPCRRLCVTYLTQVIPSPSLPAL